LKVFVSVLIAIGCLLVAPAGALAAVYTVDSTLDEPDAAPGTAGCLTAGLKCTLRAAIEESNFSTAVDDTIAFAALFNGEAADTISTGAGFPAITDKVTIDGDAAGQCTTAAAGVKGPCAGVTKTVAGSVLVVENTDGVTVDGLAIFGASGAGAAAINVLNGSEGFVVRDDWIGVKLDGGAGAKEKGIFLDPGSNGPTIGGTTAADRNVIANNVFEGLDIEGAKNADVLGNYFGVKPDGATQAANGKDIEVTDATAAPGFPAENNEIGQTIEGPALTSAACDGGCNVISGATSAGIDLNGNGSGLGELPATGPTTIRGNFVGLDAAGANVIANGSYGVLAGGADHVTVGGFPLGDANYVAGGGEGIVSESKGQDFKARGNRIGFSSGGANVTPPGTTGISVLALEVTEEASVESNRIRMAGGTAIKTLFATGRVTGNEIEGGSTGILTTVGEGAGLIASNQVETPTEYGIVVESPDNEIRANTVTGSGKAGIRVRNPPGIAMTGNLVGGSTTEKENVIEGSGGPAIEILEEALEPGSTAEIARNRGKENVGLFIDLVAGANEGILPPTFSTAIQSKAEGTAAPGAKVRVFRKASAEVGELQSFLAEATADGSGKWKVTYGSIPVGTLVAATQTNVEGATSELKIATAGADPSTGGGGSTGGDTKQKDDKGKEKKPKAGKDKTAPQTTILKKKIKGRTAKFKFVSSEAGSTFECRLDKKKFKPCRSPKKYKRLKPGKHVFEVRAIDAARNKDKTPATRKFRVSRRR
jgi:CSLREA domain-containing protein